MIQNKIFVKLCAGQSECTFDNNKQEVYNEKMKTKKMTVASPEHLKFAVLATDIAIFTVREKELFVRLIPVERPPFFTNINFQCEFEVEEVA